MKPFFTSLFIYVSLCSNGQQKTAIHWVNFENSKYGYSITYPSTWERVETKADYIFQIQPAGTKGSEVQVGLSVLSNDNDGTKNYMTKLEKILMKSLKNRPGFGLKKSIVLDYGTNPGFLIDFVTSKSKKDTQKLHTIQWLISKGEHVYWLEYIANDNFDATYLLQADNIFELFSFKGDLSKFNTSILQGRWEGTITRAAIKPYPFTMLFKNYNDETKLSETIQLDYSIERNKTDTLSFSVQALLSKDRLILPYYTLTPDNKNCFVKLVMNYVYNEGYHYLEGNNVNVDSECKNISLTLKKVSNETELPIAKRNATAVKPKSKIIQKELPISKSVSDESQSVKDAATAFLKWYEQTGDSRNFSFDFVLDKRGKPKASEENCPCSLNQNAISAYTTWLKANGRFISNSYIDDYKKELPNMKKSLKSAITSEDGSDAIEEIYVKSYLIYLGNGGNPEFGELGFYTESDKVKWKINITPDGRAVADITYSNGEEKMRVEMIKEGGSWKLAKPVRPIHEDGGDRNLVKPKSEATQAQSKIPEDVKALSPAASRLFQTIRKLTGESNGAEVKHSLSAAEKNSIVESSGLKLSKDQSLFIVNDDDEPFEAAVEVSDFNGDGKYELVLWKHDSSGPMQTSEFSIYYKSPSGLYKNVLMEYGFPETTKTKVNGFYTLQIAGPGMKAASYKWDGSKYQSSGKVAVKEKNVEPINTSKLVGGNTPEELGKNLLNALKTNNEQLWINCLHPIATTYRELSKRRFKEFREWLEEDGVADWSLVSFNRVTYSKTGFVPSNDNGEVRGEQVRRVFVIEFTYKNKEFLGGLGSMTIETFKGGNYFVFFPGKDTRLVRYRKTK